MRQAMEKWLKRHQITFSADAANSICSSLGLDGEKIDECLGLCYQFEKGNINEADFTGGLSLLTGKKPEDVMGVLRDMKGTRPKMTWDELDKKAIALFIKRHGREAYESGEIGETLERIEQRAEEYDPVFLSRHPELKGKSITVYHDPLVGDDWAVVNNETGEVVEVFNDEVMGVLRGMEVKSSIEAEITNLEKVITEGGRNISLIKEWAKREGVSQAQYLQRLKDIVEDLSIPKTFVTSLGFEVEIPVAMAVEVLSLAGENLISSGFHGALSQRWTIVSKGRISERAIKAARAAGLEVNYREMVPGTEQYFTDVSLPNVGISEIEKATKVFNKFAGLYKE